MTGRPPVLFPLFAGLETLPGVGPKSAKLFAQIGVERPRDLLFTLPHAVIDRRLRPTIRGAVLPGTVTVEVEDPLPHMVDRAAPRPERGRGLGITASVSDAWGWHPTTSGKVVWARFDRREPHPSPASSVSGRRAG